jgi:hypothetical protein
MNLGSYRPRICFELCKTFFFSIVSGTTRPVIMPFISCLVGWGEINVDSSSIIFKGCPGIRQGRTPLNRSSLVLRSCEVCEKDLITWPALAKKNWDLRKPCEWEVLQSTAIDSRGKGIIMIIFSRRAHWPQGMVFWRGGHYGHTRGNQRPCCREIHILDLPELVQK